MTTSRSISTGAAALLALTACFADPREESLAGAAQAASGIGYFYDVELIEVAHQPLNDQQGIVVHPDLGKPIYSGGAWYSKEKRWDHTHAYLAASVVDGKGDFATKPTAYDDGENYFKTYRSSSGWPGTRVNREALGSASYQQGAAQPFALRSVYVANAADHRLAVSMTADTRTSWENRKVIGARQADNVCYIQKRNERAAKVGPSGGDLPAVDDYSSSCGPIWNMASGQGPNARPTRYLSQLDAGCDGYVAAQDWVIDGRELANRTDATGSTELWVQGQLSHPTRGCFTWTLNSAAGSATPAQPQLMSSKTDILVRITRVGEQGPVFEPTPPPDLDCTLRPLEHLDGFVVDPWFRDWQSGDGVFATTFRGTKADIVDGYARQDSPANWVYSNAGGGKPLELRSVTEYAAEYWRVLPLTSPGTNYVGAPATPHAQACKRFVFAHTAEEVADWGYQEKALGVPMDNGIWVYLYGEFGPDGKFLGPRLRLVQTGPFGYEANDRMLWPYTILK